MAQPKAELSGEHGTAQAAWPMPHVATDHYLRAGTIARCVLMATKAWTWQSAKKSQALGALCPAWVKEKTKNHWVFFPVLFLRKSPHPL